MTCVTTEAVRLFYQYKLHADQKEKAQEPLKRISCGTGVQVLLTEVQKKCRGVPEANSVWDQTDWKTVDSIDLSRGIFKR